MELNNLSKRELQLIRFGLYRLKDASINNNPLNKEDKDLVRNLIKRVNEQTGERFE